MNINPAMFDFLRIRAAKMRYQAEQFNDPELYERAAADFEFCRMTAAAAACRERAKHYRELEDKIQLEPVLELIQEGIP